MSFPLSLDLMEQLINPFALLFSAIAHEVNLRRAWKIQRESKLFPHVRRCVLQSCQRQLMFFLVTCNRDVNPRRSLVR